MGELSQVREALDGLEVGQLAQQEGSVFLCGLIMLVTTADYKADSRGIM